MGAFGRTCNHSGKRSPHKSNSHKSNSHKEEQLPEEQLPEVQLTPEGQFTDKKC